MKIFLTHVISRFRLTAIPLCIVALFSTLLIFQGCTKINELLNQQVDLVVVADNLVSPLGVLEAPDGSKRAFVYDQVGKIWVYDVNGTKQPIPFLDITSKMVTLNPNFDERGLIGFTFHPNYRNNGRFFVYYNAPPRPGGPVPGVNWNNTDRISEFRVSSTNPNRADINSERIILEVDDPQSNHNGGTIAFGPDGYLYIAIGDGGGANDVGNGHVPDWYPVNAGGNGQDIYSNLLGDILRINVNGALPYGIPPDNPFVGKPGLDEIYAYGLRNPYRFSFDMKGSHQLYAGDAGQLLYEEINVIKKGGNYGWNVKEGAHCFSTANSLTILPSCPNFDDLGNKLIDPVIELNNTANPLGGKATTVIGGNVYRGQAIPGFYGKYIFGTFSQTANAPNAELFITTPRGHGMWPYQEVSLKSYPNDLGYFLKGFGQSLDGEIFLTVTSVVGPTGTTGKVLKLVPGNSGH